MGDRTDGPSHFSLRCLVSLKACSNLALTSDSVTPGQLYDYASTQMGQRISILPGVSRVSVYGTKAAVRIKADPAAMWARGISVDDLTQAVQNGTSTVGAGQLDSATGTLLLRPQGQLDRAQAYSLDNLSLMALTLAIGFLVDDAIVFLENTVRRMEHGEGALEAATNSTEEISFTILSMTVSLAAVFLPLVFMPGLVGRIFREFAITIVVAIFSSGLVSLTLTPLMCARLLKDRGEGATHTWVERVIGRFEKRVLSAYGSSLWWFLRHRWLSAMIWGLCLAGTLWPFLIIPRTFLPTGDSSFIWGVMIGQEGSSSEQMRTLQDRADALLREDPAVGPTFTMTGNSQFLSSNQGLLLLFLKPPGTRPPIQAVAGQLMGQLAAIPGVFPFLRPFPVLEISTGATQQTQGQYAYAVSGANPSQVYDVAGKLLAKLGEYPGFATFSSDLFDHTPNLDIEIQREQARTYGVSETRILALLRNAYAENYLYLIKKPEDQYQVILEVEDAARSKPEDLSRLYIKSDDGARLVPLRALVRWKPSLGPQAVNHLNQFTSVTLFFNLKPGVAIGDATDLIRTTAAEIVPSTVRASLQGEALTFSDTVRNLTFLMALAVFVMYVILAILYESYVHPLTVLSTLPTALVGGLLTLYLFREQASLYAFVGMFMLMGIVKKNGIMIVDFAIQRLATGKSVPEAIHDASLNRFRPIIMTTLAAVMGAIPIAVGYGADGASRGRWDWSWSAAWSYPNSSPSTSRRSSTCTWSSSRSEC